MNGRGWNARRARTSLRAGLMCLLLVLASRVDALAQTCLQAPSGIVAWWTFDETSGSTAQDIAGTNPGVRVGGPIPSSGQVAGALHFDGSASYVGVGDSDQWAFGSNDFTIELWANFDVPGSGTVGHPGDIFIGNDEGPGTVNKWFFALGGGVLNFHVNGPATGSAFLVQAPFSPSVGRWYHLAVTRSGGRFTIFVDGSPVGSEMTTVDVPNANAPLTIGQAEDLGFMHGMLDEVSVYHRALTQQEIAAVAGAGKAGKCKRLMIVTRAVPATKLAAPSTFQFNAQFGVPPLSWALAAGNLPAGVTLSPDGVLSGTASESGTFPFTVRVSDDQGNEAEGAFALDVLLMIPRSKVRIQKTGTVAVPGRTIDYFILLENTGGTTAEHGGILEALEPPSFFTLLATEPPADSADGSGILWTVPSLQPGEVKTFSYSVGLDPLVPAGTTIFGQASWLDQDRFGTPRCALCKPACASCFFEHKECGPCKSCLFANGCPIGPPPTPVPTPEPDPPLLCASEDVKLLILKGILEGGSPVDACFPQPARRSKDPNEKTAVAKKYMQPSDLLVYPIEFENIGDIEARDVFITDTLDPKLDPSTLSILAANGASYDAVSRTVRWDLLGRDLQPHETGHVSLAIRPLPGLPSGAEIRNTATIRFEVFEEIPTNEVLNIIDTVKPTCTMQPLPSEIFDSTFSISWSGTDAVGEIESYAILVSEDGGTFVPFLQKTSRTSATFTGSLGETYSFLCIATDTAGNVEVQAPVAETATKLLADTTPPTITISASSPTLWPPNGSLVPEVISGRMTDALSGVDPTTAEYRVVDEYGVVEPRGQIAVTPDGTYSFTIMLEATRRGQDLDGRQYVITVAVSDKKGNSASSSTRVTVPHDQREQRR